MRVARNTIKLIALVMIIFVQINTSNNIVHVDAQVENGMIPPKIIAPLENFECTQTTYASTSYGLLFAMTAANSGTDLRSIYILKAENMIDENYDFKIVKEFNVSTIDFFYPSIVQINKNIIAVAFTMQTSGNYRIGIVYANVSKDIFTAEWSSIKTIGSGNVSYIHPTIVNDNGNITLFYAANHTGIFNIYKMSLNTTLYQLTNETQITFFNTNALQPRIISHANNYYMTFIKDNDNSINGTDYDIYITSSNNLINWTSPILAAENDENGNNNDMMPSLFVNDNGVFMLYFESETISGHKIYSAYSADGKTWLRPRKFWLNAGIDPLIGKDSNNQLFLMFSEGYPIQQLKITRRIFTISASTPKISTSLFTINIKLSDVITNEPGKSVNEYTNLKMECIIYEVPPGIMVTNSTDMETLENITTTSLTYDSTKDIWSVELSALNFERGQYVAKIFIVSDLAQGSSPVSISFEIKIDRQTIYIMIAASIAVVAIALWFRHVKKKER